jgi:hypothetical protein
MNVTGAKSPIHAIVDANPQGERAMVRRTGSADLPLHGGRVPPWLAQRMATLGAIIAEAIVHHYGRDELLARLSNPFWFQSFGAVMGMDWHSSGITTSVIGALKRGLVPLEAELGIHVCGGRGKHSRRTPQELTWASASAREASGAASTRNLLLTRCCLRGKSRHRSFVASSTIPVSVAHSPNDTAKIPK